MMPKKNKGINKQKLLIKISQILGSLVIIGVILVLLPLSLPRLLGYETFNVVSESMEPAIPVGSLILVKPKELNKIQEGDVIAFYKNENVVCHRVVQNNIFEYKFVTKGDANADNDADPVMYTDVLGVVANHFPLMGTLGSYFSTSSGKLMLAELMVCSLLLFIVSDKIKV